MKISTSFVDLAEGVEGYYCFYQTDTVMYPLCVFSNVPMWKDAKIGETKSNLH
jgi:hypothetical protein